MGRFTTMLTGTLAVALIACADRRGESRTAVQDTPAAAPRGAANPPAPPPAPQLPSWQEPDGWRPESPLPGLVHLEVHPSYALKLYGSRADSADRGIAVVGVGYYAPNDSGHPGRRSTVWFRREPRGDAPPVAGLVMARYSDSSMAKYTLFGPAGTRPNVVALLEQEYTVPADSFADGWARGILGWDSAGARVLGWASVSDTSEMSRTTLLRWSGHLAKEARYFLHDSTTRLFASLADTLAPGDPLPPIEGGTHVIAPLETRGRWMRVRLTYPDEICSGAEVDSTAIRTREVWTPYLDRRGRPLVWWPVEGC